MAIVEHTQHTDSIGDDLIDAAARVLGEIERLPADATGALRFGNHGIVLVESRQVCWAAARGMQTRLTDLLRHQRNPPLDRGYLDRVVRECERTKAPLGESLLATGQVTPQGLRTALLVQTTEAIAHLARDITGPAEFVAHVHSRYDARFVFSSAELFAAIGAWRDRPLAAAATTHLREMLVPGVGGFAYLPPARHGLPTIVTVNNLERVGVFELLAVSRWAFNMHEVSASLDPTVHTLAASWRQRGAVVSWRRVDAQFAAMCPNHAASAMLIARLEQSRAPTEAVR